MHPTWFAGKTDLHVLRARKRNAGREGAEFVVGDARAFVSRWRFPKAVRPINLVLFRTLVAGRSIDLDDARALLRDLPLGRWEVSRVSGTPALLMRGERSG